MWPDSGYLTPDNAPPAVAGTLGKIALLHVFQLVAHAESAFRPWLRFGGALLNDLARTWSPGTAWGWRAPCPRCASTLIPRRDRTRSGSADPITITG